MASQQRKSIRNGIPASHSAPDMDQHTLQDTKNADRLQLHVKKLDVMKEGLNQMKAVIVDKTLPFKEALDQGHLLRKKLSNTPGQPSKCSFTLVLFYLFGNVRNIELDASGGTY